MSIFTFAFFIIGLQLGIFYMPEVIRNKNISNIKLALWATGWQVFFGIGILKHWSF